MKIAKYISESRPAVKFVYELVKGTAVEFFKEKSFFHGAALAYYTVFAMVPLLYLSITFFGWFVGNEVMIQIISELLTQYIGIKDIDGILDFLKTVDFEKGSFVLNAIGIGALALSSTALLTSLKMSMNVFYDVEPIYSTKRKKMLQTVVAKLVSLVMMTTIGLLVIIFYFSETVLLSLSKSIFQQFDTLNWFFNFVLVHTFAVISNTIIFMVVFKFLHDGVVLWRRAFFGALFTGTMLYLGQILIKFYLSNYFFAASGGVAGS
ncbi:MAG: YihY/virulence factor BrkB family protein, partial [Bacteroidetes bacterium]|nr:YihY/virulence factor BrkB family protein [Bacteroidota bacterium]